MLLGGFTLADQKNMVAQKLGGPLDLEPLNLKKGIEQVFHPIIRVLVLGLGEFVLNFTNKAQQHLHDEELNG